MRICTAYLPDGRFDYYFLKVVVGFNGLEVLVEDGYLLLVVPAGWTERYGRLTHSHTHRYQTLLHT